MDGHEDGDGQHNEQLGVDGEGSVHNQQAVVGCRSDQTVQQNEDVEEWSGC